MDTSFLKTLQKNTNIQFSNFDFSHVNDYSSKLGQILVTQCTKVLPNDYIKHRVNEETILQALENPSFSKFKHVHKSFYYPNTVLWKYWDNFLTNKPKDLWTNSQITDYINERQPYSIPKCYFIDLLPYLAVAGGFVTEMRLHAYIPQMNYILSYLDSVGFNQDALQEGYLGLCPPYYNTMGTGSRAENTTLLYDESSVGSKCCLYNETANQSCECGFYYPNGDYSIGTTYSTDFDFTPYEMLESVKNVLSSYSSESWYKYLDVNNLRWYVTFKIASQSVFKPQYCKLIDLDYRDNVAPVRDQQDFRNLIVPDFRKDSSFRFIDQSFVESHRFFSISNYDQGTELATFMLPIPSAIESTSMGFSPLAYFFYNCQNIAKHCDHLGITIPQDFINFNESDLFLPINLLPFIAYNRFYHENIADKQRQTNCPYWYDANGLLSPKGMTSQRDDSSLEKYQNIGWTLHFDDIPYNKRYNLLDQKIVIGNSFAAHMLLSGININLLIASTSIQTTDQFYKSGLYYQDLIGNQYPSFLTPVFQMYNGLLHLQYANFSPDYFNSSVMDPLAGAQDIQIPSTITQLQEKSKLQELLNQTAWTRNIKEFLQSQFDAFSKYTTIDDATITGQSDVDVNISQVIQTSETSNTPLGTRAGIGSAYGNVNLCDDQFHEFGYYMTVSYFVMESYYINRLDKNVIAELNYLELPFPQLSNLGNEAIHMHEVKFGASNYFDSINLTPLSISPFVHQYASVYDGDQTSHITKPQLIEPHQPVTDHSLQNRPIPTYLNHDDTNSGVNFGYIPRFSSYKFKFDEVHGEFLSTLKNWVPTRELHITPLQTYNFISYENQAQLSNLMKNFVDKDTLNSDAFLTNSYHVMNVRRCLPFIVNPKF